jgi:nucleotide-binding universal stress UspA family protein
MFERILVPYNRSEAAEIALEQALLLAKRHGSTLHGVYVIDAQLYAYLPHQTEMQGFAGFAPLTDTWSADIRGRWQEVAGDALEHFAQRCADEGVACRTAQHIGFIGDTLLDAARDADVVVLAHTHLERPLGAVLEMLARHSPVAVWLALNQPLLPHHATLAFDGSKHAASALRVASDLAQHWGIALDVLVVQEGERIGMDTLLHAQRELRECHARAGELVYAHDTAAHGILEHTQADTLMVMGTSGHRRVLGLGFDHTFNQVLRGAHGALLICP